MLTKIVDLMAMTSLPAPASWSDMLTVLEVSPGVSKTYTFGADKGPLYLVCWSKPPDLAVDNVGPFEVKWKSKRSRSLFPGA